MFLIPGIYGKEFSPKIGPFGLRCGQLRAKDFTHNSGWYNKKGEKIGWGDLSIEDFNRITKEIPTNEVFIVLSEQNSFWNFVTGYGMLGSLCDTDKKIEMPGLDYVCEKFSYMIITGKCYSRLGEFKESDIEFQKMTSEEAKKLCTELRKK